MRLLDAITTFCICTCPKCPKHFIDVAAQTSHHSSSWLLCWPLENRKENKVAHLSLRKWLRKRNASTYALTLTLGPMTSPRHWPSLLMPHKKTPLPIFPVTEKEPAWVAGTGDPQGLSLPLTSVSETAVDLCKR